MSAEVVEYSGDLEVADVSVSKTPYQLREMDADVHGEYMSKQVGRMQMDESGKPTGMKDFKGLYVGLLVYCLFDAEGAAVPEEKIKKWPARTVEGLFKMAQKMNGLNKEAQADAKKDSAATGSSGIASPPS